MNNILWDNKDFAVMKLAFENHYSLVNKSGPILLTFTEEEIKVLTKFFTAIKKAEGER